MEAVNHPPAYLRGRGDSLAWVRTHGGESAAARAARKWRLVTPETPEPDRDYWQAWADRFELPDRDRLRDAPILDDSDNPADATSPEAGKASHRATEPEPPEPTDRRPPNRPAQLEQTGAASLPPESTESREKPVASVETADKPATPQKRKKNNGYKPTGRPPGRPKLPPHKRKRGGKRKPRIVIECDNTVRIAVKLMADQHGKTVSEYLLGLTGIYIPESAGVPKKRKKKRTKKNTPDQESA